MKHTPSYNINVLETTVIKKDGINQPIVFWFHLSYTIY